VSWQLGAFTILALGLAAGFAWYERRRPDARIVALVATLAAFAALGRIAFAALPNVKPTTDIVLVSGYALGGPPGFVVGALAGFSSNFFFGQGPWTPWQMGAWGVTGLLGAGLARVWRKPVNRWLLALVCGVAGFAFTAFQDVGDWVTYSDHSLSQLGVYVGKGIGFDFVHAAGCVVFAVAFGPALARSIGRFAARLHVTWLAPRGVIAPVLIVLAAASLASPSRPGGEAAASAASAPTGYLLSAQNGDGGFGPASGSRSSQLYAGWAALGLAAAGYNPRNVRHGGPSLTDYISGGESPQTDSGSLERTILVLRAAGLRAGGLASALEGRIGADGSVSHQVNLTSFGVLALRAAGAAPSGRTIGWLLMQQDADGGFNFATRGAGSDVDDTGAALEALTRQGGGATSRAVRFIDGEENGDGGFPSQPGGPSNAQSTAWAIQGLLAAGVSFGSLGRPLGYLRSLIAPDGHVRYSAGTDQTPVWVTAQAEMALAGKPLPLAPVALQSAAPPARRSGVRAARPHSSTALKHAKRAAAAPVDSASLRQLALDLAIAYALALAPVS
jgi:energy-coupling factor transport system substrate-specific component